MGYRMIEVTWNQVENHCREFVERSKLTNQYDLIIGVGRGGLVPAVIISHQMGVALHPINFQTRDGKEAESLEMTIVDFSKIIAPLEAMIESNGTCNVLIVDDINDSGKTLTTIVKCISQYMQIRNVSGVVNSYAVFQRTGSSFNTTDYGELVDSSEWLVFPWESE